MSKYTNWEHFYQKLNIIFHGIIAGTLIPFAFVFLETQKEFPEGPLLEGQSLIVIKGILIFISVVLIIASQLLRKKRLFAGHTPDEIGDRLKSYLNKKIILFAVLEGSALFALIGLYLSKDHLFTGLYLVVLLVFSLQRPTFDRVVRETGIPEEELDNWGKLMRSKEN